MSNEKEIMQEVFFKDNRTVTDIYNNYKIIKKEKGLKYANSVLKKILKNLFDNLEIDLINEILIKNRKEKILDTEEEEMLHFAIILSKNVKYNLDQSQYSPSKEILKQHEKVIIRSKDSKASIKFLLENKSDKIAEHLALINNENIEEAEKYLEEEYNKIKKDKRVKAVYDEIKKYIVDKKEKNNEKEK